MKTRELALEIVGRLEAAGHLALLAGGCVRDWLMGQEPKDHDVATSARPEEVQQLFGHRRTLAIGASFGVIAVLSASRDCQVEVATFRTDGGYSDGRRPDSVAFSDARNDALRRDFTINGLFQNATTGEIIDYVDGRRDLEERVVRAIGDPHRRIGEDKLRMLRGVRFATRFGFEMDGMTRAAIVRHAAEIRQVSGERIGAEMRRMLVHSSRAAAVEMLLDLGLLDHIVDRAGILTASLANWRTRLKWLDRLEEPVPFAVAATVLLGPLIREEGVQPLMERWKLPAAEAQAIRWMEDHWVTLLRAGNLPWSTLQPLLVTPWTAGALQIAAAAAGPDQTGVRWCRHCLAWPPEKLNPPPLIDGAALKQLGLQPGPQFGRLLQEIRRAQLDGEIVGPDGALQRVCSLMNDSAGSEGGPCDPRGPESAGRGEDD